MRRCAPPSTRRAAAHGRARGGAHAARPRRRCDLAAARRAVLSAPAATRASSSSCRRPSSSSPRRPPRGCARPPRSSRARAARPGARRRPRPPGRGRRAPVRRARRASSTRATATRAIEAEYGVVARRQLVCALQVHVAVGGADRALAVYNALRALPARARRARGHGAVPRRPRHRTRLDPPEDLRAAPAPGHAAGDGVAGRRSPTALAWGAASGARARAAPLVVGAAPAPVHGTLEVRVPDAQATSRTPPRSPRSLQALVAWLADRHDAGEALGAAADLAASRRTAGRRCATGSTATLADLATRRAPTARERLQRAARRAGAAPRALGCAAELGHAARAAAANAPTASAGRRGVGLGAVPRPGWLTASLDGCCG